MTPRRLIRLAVRIALVASLLLAVYVGGTFVQVYRSSRHNGAVPADAIVVLGAAQYNGRPSPVLRGRLDHALDLYRQGIAPRVVLTGGRQEGDAFTEATGISEISRAPSVAAMSDLMCRERR